MTVPNLERFEAEGFVEFTKLSRETIGKKSMIHGSFKLKPS